MGKATPAIRMIIKDSNGKIEDVFEFNPCFTKRGYLCLFHSWLIDNALTAVITDGNTITIELAKD